MERIESRGKRRAQIMTRLGSYNHFLNLFSLLLTLLVIIPAHIIPVSLRSIGHDLSEA